VQQIHVIQLVMGYEKTFSIANSFKVPPEQTEACSIHQKWIKCASGLATTGKCCTAVWRSDESISTAGWMHPSEIRRHHPDTHADLHKTIYMPDPSCRDDYMQMKSMVCAGVSTAHQNWREFRTMMMKKQRPVFCTVALERSPNLHAWKKYPKSWILCLNHGHPLGCVKTAINFAVLKMACIAPHWHAGKPIPLDNKQHRAFRARVFRTTRNTHFYRDIYVFNTIY